MAVRVADKIKQFNNANFFLMDAGDVEMSNGKSVEEKFAEKGQPNGYAGLDSNGEIPSSHLTTVLNVLLTGLSIATNSAITASDSIINALGKLQAQINARLSLTGGTMTGNIAMGGNKIISSAIPSADDEYTNKKYVDDAISNAISNAMMLECVINDSDGGTLLDSSDQPVLGRINVINVINEITNMNEIIEDLKQHAILDSTF